MADKGYKQKLAGFINDANLKFDQRLLWELFLKISNAEEDEAVYEAVCEGKENIFLLTNHLRDKILEMKKANMASWEKLANEEEKYANLLN